MKLTLMILIELNLNSI